MVKTNEKSENVKLTEMNIKSSPDSNSLISSSSIIIALLLCDSWANEVIPLVALEDGTIVDDPESCNSGCK